MILNIKSAEYRHNPYPSFKLLRAEAPICRIEPHGYWAISRYSDVQMILKNPNIFSSSGIVKEPSANTPEFLMFSRGLIGTDGPDHARLRRLISKAFTPKTIQSFELKIRLLCKELIKKMMNLSSINFVQEFSMPLPILVISELLGIDPEKKNDFKRWANILISWRNQKLTCEISNEIEQMFVYFNEIIIARKQNPKTDLVSALILACENDKLITGDEVLGFMRLLLVAGTETTTNLLGNAMLALLSHLEQMKHVQQDHTKIPNFIEESLRYDGPALSLTRKVNSEIEISGVKLQKGDIVLPLLASANHDETKFADPERFDIERNTQGHLAFGNGPHYCIGSQLARLQTRIAFEEIFKNFISFDRLNSEPLAYIDSFFFRGVRSLYLNMKQTMSSQISLCD